MPKRSDTEDLGRTRKWQLLKRERDQGITGAEQTIEAREIDEHEHDADFREAEAMDQISGCEIYVGEQPMEEGNSPGMQDYLETTSDVLSNDSEANSEHGDSENEGSGFDDDCEEENSDVNDHEEGVPDVDELPNLVNGDQPVYDGAPITVAEGLLAILTMSFIFNMIGSCLAAVLQLISMFCKQPSLMRDTLFKFKNVFKLFKSPMVRHYYCEKCWAALDNENSACNCANRKETSFFLEIPVIDQLNSLFSQESFCKSLKQRFHRKKKQEDNLEDIWDGKLYQKFSKPGGFLSEENNLSFSWYTDGIPIFKSKKYSVWPIYLVINELPYEKRTSQENIIVCGLWFGPSDPQVNLFLKPLHFTFQRLFAGIKIRPFGEANPITVRGILLSGTADTPARCDFMCHVRFNGDYGCLKCLAKGYTIRGENFGNTHIYPFEGEETSRTKKMVEQHAAEALGKDRPVYGVKEPSLLSKIMPDAVRGVGIDVMHCVFIGVFKKLMSVWFDSKLRHEPFSLYRHLDIVDARLALVKPPDFVQRLPRSIKQHLSFWKASEFKNFFFYYSLPLLEDLMPKTYFNHFKKLVCALWLLCSESISADMLNDSEKLLYGFVSQFQSLYDSRFMSINIHMLLHLPEVTRDMGPLWVLSCFPFEDLNGKLAKMVHGTRHVGLQVYSCVAHGTILPYLVSQLPESRAKEFSVRLLSKQRRQNLIKVSENYSIIGKLFTYNPVPNYIKDMLDSSGMAFKKIQIFYRLRNRRQVFYSSEYSRKKSKFSCCALYTGSNGDKCFGLIKVFVFLCDCNDAKCAEECSGKCFAIINKGQCVPCFVTGPRLTIEEYANVLPIEFVQKYTSTDEYTLLPAKSLNCVCFFVEVGNTRVVAEPVNTVEIE